MDPLVQKYKVVALHSDIILSSLSASLTIHQSLADDFCTVEIHGFGPQ